MVDLKRAPERELPTLFVPRFQVDYPPGNLTEQESSCGLGNFPRVAFPPWAQGETVELTDGQTQASIVYQEDIDTLITDVSFTCCFQGPPEGDPPVAPPATACSCASGDANFLDSVRVRAEYCNIVILDDVLASNYPCCCGRKPPFTVGVRGDKRLKFTFDFLAPLSVPAGARRWLRMNLVGFQGKGCC